MGHVLKKLGVIIGSIIIICGVYAFASWNSMRKVDEFCNSIDPSTKMQDLPSLAQRIGVDIQGPIEMKGDSGTYYYAISSSGFTMGEYACSVHSPTLAANISSKHLGY